MAEEQNNLKFRTQAGDPVKVGAFTLTLLAQSLSWRNNNLGFIWNRPLAVLVEQDGQRQRLPIYDYTRIYQAMFLLLGFLFALITLSTLIPRKEKNND